ncbi:hypothetical protein VMCG_02875 [Cytospora schulzeri]|uniref:Zn(2)-C6 fungal-type domain-containing protein n=1 Tax=Cytospora schulzeri TaxID=448051 RepID=A0A423WZZ8_9PEZI|nr:hypothetical protein VMCG_02875 [Valsa malicola]
MTVPLPTPSNPKVDAAAVRKRRRRAPAGGAADDCFTCTKRNVKCDRRRPYCSQCLEVGNECSGYKTQLTWGVGVASRGKLRGLSLPIAKSPPVNPIKKSSPSRSRANSSLTGGQGRGHATNAGHWNEQEALSPRGTRGDIIDGPVDRHYPVSMPPTPFHVYDLSKISHAEPTPPMPSGAGHWGNVPFSPSLAGDGPRFPKLGPILAHGPPEPLSSSIDSLSDAEYLSPLSHTFSRDDLPFATSPTHMYAESYNSANSPIPQSPMSSVMMDHHRAPTSCPSLVYAPSEPSSSLHSHMDGFEAHLSNRLMEYEPLATPGLDAYSTSAHSDRHFWAQSPEEDSVSTHGVPDQPLPWPSVLDQPVLPVNQDLIVKMQFYMEYYENIMCPGMVFIDGPSNPFRDHILSLAANSRSLQHAICALAACNIRMKRKLSLAHGQDEKEHNLPRPMSEIQSDERTISEEYQHRNLAVHLLNEQLNDPTKARGDAVLATILLLCHYRMAESGIAKFHTQFAGVKKILGMRRSSPFPPSRDSAWMEALFTYFDAISASINDRESQLNTSFYGVMPDAQLLPLGAENLVGCDRELFKTIIKLGRLNILSQHRPVQSLLSPPTSRGVPSRSQSPFEAPIGNIYKPQHQHHTSADIFGSHHPRFDGNGFSTTIDEEQIITPSLSSSAYDDHRSTFWREWKDARIALQSWEFDAQRVLASLPDGLSATHAQVRDLGSLSEAFRYAALLYTERLASPNVSSAHNNFRNLVSQVVYYATSLEAGSSAEKFLLWPLFVAGSECVNEMQQGVVRSKCREIMARSGYMNNLAALDVLERIWSGEGRDQQLQGLKPSIVRRGPFSWTKCIGGPGVEVEWIMF